MASLTDRYAKMSGREHAVVWLVIVLAAFLFWLEVDTRTQAFADRAETAERQLAVFESQMAARSRGGGGLERGLERHGEVAWVDDADDRQSEMVALVQRLVEEHDIPDGWRSTPKTVALRADAAAGVFEGRRVDRLVNTFTFESTPERMTAIVRDLEASPIVVSVNTLNARVLDERSKSLAVTLEYETWVWREGGRRR